jgi:hypothetical protein
MTLRHAAALGTHVHSACDDAGSRFLGWNNEAREEGVQEANMHGFANPWIFCCGSQADMVTFSGHNRYTLSRRSSPNLSFAARYDSGTHCFAASHFSNHHSSHKAVGR